MDESGIFIEKDPSSEKTHTDKPKLPKKEKRHSTSSSSTQTSEENTGNGMETMTTETAGNSNLELDDCSAELREACGGLVMRKKETEAEIEGCKEQIR